MARKNNKRRKIVFIGAGSLGFTKKIIIDILSCPALADSRLALVDIDKDRLKYSFQVAQRIIEQGKYGATVEAFASRKDALKDADYVIVTILAHGYEGFRREIEIPRKYGVNQAVGDTTGPGGVMRAQRTIPIMLDIARDMERYSSPGALMLNYTNPMHMLSWAIYENSSINYVGLCHSVQGTAEMLARLLELPYAEVRYLTAGINHQAWVLKFEHQGRDFLPQIRKKAEELDFYQEEPVRCEICRQLGYFVTESSPHNSEYLPWFRKKPEILARYVPGGQDDYGMILAEYRKKADDWKDWLKDLASGKVPIDLTRSHEYGANIINAVETDEPFRFNGNIRNITLIPNLPEGSCVETPCIADGLGIRGIPVSPLPPQLAAVNRMNISVHELAVRAAIAKDPEMIFQAIALDPLTAAVLSLQEIRDMTKEMLLAQEKYLPGYKVRKFASRGAVKGFGKEHLVQILGRKKAELFQELNIIDRFYVLGPFENADSSGRSLGLAKNNGPEEAIDLKAGYKGKTGRKISWKKIGPADIDDNGFVNLLILCGNMDMAVGYAYTVLEAIMDCKVELEFGSDDGIAIWLNGKEIIRKEGARSAIRSQNRVALYLKHGKNDLLLKVDQIQGDWGFYANFARRYTNVSVRLA